MHETSERAHDRPRRTGERRARVGGRSERVVQSVLGAAAAELARGGYAALRMEDVAERAGVNKTTIYRRWPTKVDLVGATVRAMRAANQDPPNTGSLRGDVMELLQRALKKAATPEGQCLIRMLILEVDHPEVAALTRALRAENLLPWIDVLTRAIDRGELPNDTEPRLVAETILGVVTSRRLFFSNDPGNEAYILAVADLVLTGAKHGGAARAGVASKKTVPAKRARKGAR